MLKQQQEIKQASLLQKVSQDPEPAEVSSNPSNLQRMWDYLRRYKTDHAKSSLPTQLYSNASKDKIFWVNGPLSTLARTWHHYRSTLGQNLIEHKESPHNEETAKTLQARAPMVAAQAAHPTQPINPLFDTPILMSELVAALKALIPDKSPGEDGITNRMLQSGGPNFRFILKEVFDTLWEHEVQPAAWERSLLQPIFTGGGKDQADPASCRGIYLSSALAKLFEGILIYRLTQFTEAHNTLTENQLGMRPGCQVHDATYIILSIIQYNYIKKGHMWRSLIIPRLSRLFSAWRYTLSSKDSILRGRCGNTYVPDSTQSKCEYYTRRYRPHGGSGFSMGCLREVV